MRKIVILFAALCGCVLFTHVALSAEDEGESQKITVKSKQISNGVVILAVQEGKNAFELQCNKDASGCAVLDPGDYLMARLSKNHGLYDCANAEVYQKSASSERDNMLGQYCVIDTN
jgi:trehalose-6-phosphatase